MDTLITLYLFIIGAACGSFALVLADRLHTKRDWVKGRSACEHCKHLLAPINLVPILSWLYQRGKCRYCQKKIGVAYPLTELLSAVLFSLSYALLPYDVTSVATWVMFISWLFALVLFTALFIYDLRWKLLPTVVIRPLIVLGAIHAVAGYSQSSESIIRYGAAVVMSVLVGAGVFWALYQVSRGKWIGDGDIRFGVVIGLFLADPLLSWSAIFAASLYGLVYAAWTMPKKGKKLHMQIPFGPFLILGLVTSYLVGSHVIDWYFSTFLYL